MLWGAVGVAQADGMFPKTPMTVAQSYADGSGTSLHCPVQPVGATTAPCTFVVRAAGAPPRSYAFRFGDSGYSDVLYDYAWFPGDASTFQVSVEVECNARDRALLPQATEDNTRCRLYFAPKDDALVPVYVELLAFDRGQARSASRTLGTSMSPDDFRDGDAINTRCNTLYWAMTRAYVQHASDADALARLAARLEAEHSPLFEILDLPDEPAQDETPLATLSNSAIRVLGDEACGTSFDEYVAGMLFPDEVGDAPGQSLLRLATLVAARRLHVGTQRDAPEERR